jgi:hypothetical protein
MTFEVLDTKWDDGMDMMEPEGQKRLKEHCSQGRNFGSYASDEYLHFKKDSHVIRSTASKYFCWVW